MTDLHDRIRRAIAEALDEDEGQMRDAAGLWYLGKRDSEWFAGRLIASPVVAALLTIAVEAAKAHENCVPWACMVMATLGKPCPTRQALDTLEGEWDAEETDPAAPWNAGGDSR